MDKRLSTLRFIVTSEYMILTAMDAHLQSSLLFLVEITARYNFLVDDEITVSVFDYSCSNIAAVLQTVEINLQDIIR